jgi:hypothetical protein
LIDRRNVLYGIEGFNASPNTFIVPPENKSAFWIETKIISFYLLL